MEQLDATLAAWRAATAPLNAKASAFLPPSALISSGSGAQKKKEGGSCRPWSHADFGARVASFGIATWFAKPAAVSALACARHGWRHSGRPDELRCDSCQQLLCFEIDAKLSEEGVQRVASAFAEMLTSGHSPLCPWRENPSPEAFASLPIASLEQVRESLVKRVERTLAACASDAALTRALGALRLESGVLESVLESGDSVSRALAPVEAGATVSEETQLVVPATEALAPALVRKFGDLVVRDDESGSLSTLLLHVAVVSACGWELGFEEEESAGVARCEICCRRWSVASYSAAASLASPPASEADADRAAKRQKVAHAAALDPVAQHRWFCPWVTARKQEASRDVSGGVSADDDVAKYGENDARLWEFMLLPGWKQYAKALRTVADTGEGGSKQNASEKRTLPTRPEHALESVRAVLGLPDW